MSERPYAGARPLEETIGRVLRAGLAASTVCLAAGLALSLVDVAPRVARFLLTLGLLVLLSTPASRVVVSAVSFARSRDWLFVTLTLIVFLELVASVVAATYGLVGSP